MAGRDEPSLPPGQLSLLDFRLGVKQATPDVDRAVIEAQVEARLQREEAAKSAADAIADQGPQVQPGTSTTHRLRWRWECARL
jgi:hypothetical protein